MSEGEITVGSEEFERERAAAYRDAYRELEAMGRRSIAEAVNSKPPDQSPFEQVLFRLYDRIVVAFKRSLVDGHLPTSEIILTLAQFVESTYQGIYFVRLVEFAQRAGFYAGRALPEIFLSLLPENARGHTSSLWRRLEDELLAEGAARHVAPVGSSKKAGQQPQSAPLQARDDEWVHRLPSAQGGGEPNKPAATEPSRDESTRTEAGPGNEANNNGTDRRKGVARRPGRKANVVLNSSVVRVLRQHGDDWREKLDDVCHELSQKKVPLPASEKWRKRGCDDWVDVLAEDREGLVKALQYRLDWAKRSSSDKE